VNSKTKESKHILIDVKTFGTWQQHLHLDYDNWLEKQKIDSKKTLKNGNLSAEAKYTYGYARYKEKKLAYQFGGYINMIREKMGIEIDECYCWHIHPYGQQMIKVKPKEKEFMETLEEYLIYKQI